MLSEGSEPTAVSITTINVTAPATDYEGADGNTGIYEHWNLAHYLIDGHHKTYAAAVSGKPITLISFLALDWGAPWPKPVAENVEAEIGVLVKYLVKTSLNTEPSNGFRGTIAKIVRGFRSA